MAGGSDLLARGWALLHHFGLRLGHRIGVPMPVPRSAHPAVGLAMQDWRAVAFGTAPILAGVAVPWLLWGSLGWLNSGELAVAGFMSTAGYLRLVWMIGEHENEARRRLGRRYLAPGPTIALTLCVGLLVTLMAPGLSAVALIEAVGLPRAAGVVRSYESAALAELGGTLDLVGLGLTSVSLGGGPLQLHPDGNAWVLDRSGAAAPIQLSWAPRAGGLCIVIDDIVGNACLALDPRSGRLRDGERDVGRVTSVGLATIDRRQ
jgi:hypothetical protein